MWRFSKQAVANPASTGTKSLGDAAEDAALAHLQAAGLKLVQRNFRTPGRGGGEVDLIMREPHGTLVFIEVRLRRSQSHGGAGASITATKRRRIVFAARHFLLRYASPPPCRFDVVLLHASDPMQASTHKHLPSMEWLQGAFSADGGV